MKKIIAAASFGGHWVQLQRLRPLLDQHRTVFVSTSEGLSAKFSSGNYCRVCDAAADNKVKLCMLFFQAFYHVIRIRPDIVITTGAAPGLAFVIAGRLLGAKTIWIDSIANAEAISLSGRLAKRWSSLWLSQWQDVAEREGASYLGSVI